MRGSLCGGRNKGREGEKSAKEKRESNRPPFFSSSKSPSLLMPTLRALYEGKERKRFWSFLVFKSRNPGDEGYDYQPTFDQR